MVTSTLEKVIRYFSAKEDGTNYFPSGDLVGSFSLGTLINPQFLRKFVPSSVGIEYKGYSQMAPCICKSRKRGITQKERLVLLLYPQILNKFT